MLDVHDELVDALHPDQRDRGIAPGGAAVRGEQSSFPALSISTLGRGVAEGRTQKAASKFSDGDDERVSLEAARPLRRGVHGIANYENENQLQSIFES